MKKKQPPLKDKNTGLNLTHPENLPLAELPPAAAVEEALSAMILSASGWRTVFASSGEEEDPAEEIDLTHQLLAAAIGSTYADFFRDSCGEGSLIYVGMDSRPTGPAIADPILRLFLARGLRPRFLFITAAPEIMAAARTNPEAQGFLYISASHNPIGHNGIKGGLKTGGVLTGSQAAPLAEAFRRTSLSETARRILQEEIRRVDPEEIRQLYQEIAPAKEETFRLYHTFLQETAFPRETAGASGGNSGTQVDLRTALIRRPLGILGELNGSARALAPDQPYLEGLGLKTAFINNTPRQIIHRIVPEGRSLDLCARELEALHRRDPAFQLGFVPDNDGDRGNIVFIDTHEGKESPSHQRGQPRSRILEAQQVFALSVLAELASLAAAGTDMSRVAVPVNGPTSMIIEDIAQAFGSRVFRAEVGEANVVSLAQELTEKGWILRILGEGSNGGNITRPAAVRDPLNTLTALAKLLRHPDNLFSLWCRQSGQPDRISEEYSLADVLASLPPWSTTSAYEEEAVMKISTLDHSRLKAAFEARFPREWESRKTRLASWGITSWREINYEGTEAKEGVGPAFRSGAEKGGLKILLEDKKGGAQAFLWMRGSGTEPVFRVMAEIRGSDEEARRREKELLQWLREMVRQADISS